MSSPEFSTEGMFVATLKRPPKGRGAGEKLTKNQVSIVEAIQRNNKITQTELAKAIGVSTTSIENNLRKLRQLGNRFCLSNYLPITAKCSSLSDEYSCIF